MCGQEGRVVDRVLIWSLVLVGSSLGLRGWRNHSLMAMGIDRLRFSSLGLVSFCTICLVLLC